jgi:catechol 2,3-dioxygenase-like lactoylglutathione lyase family enzyme
VDSITLELSQRGVNILYKDRHPYVGGPDYYAVYFEDPDRIKVEIVGE